eukprot:TRINITY_DN19517_c0_g1_i1.p1 TRINITY_DN19517_c0_g1~~TRINITY_DN19517_c0_g1_i1.p1  ORF type:complete len:178 (+),score=3.75 TRINITY_DN19517_c0_g1_i1:71-535(+)
MEPALKEVDSCQRCSLGLGPLRRGHCCRRCGGVFCSGCARVRRGPAAGGPPTRVCMACNSVTVLFRFIGWEGTAETGKQFIQAFNGSEAVEKMCAAQTAPATKSINAVFYQPPADLIETLKEAYPTLPPTLNYSAYFRSLVSAAEGHHSNVPVA